MRRRRPIGAAIICRTAKELVLRTPIPSAAPRSASLLLCSLSSRYSVHFQVPGFHLSLRSQEKCILAPKVLAPHLYPVRLSEMKELMSILVTIYLLDMLFLPISSYLAQTTSEWLSPRSLGCFVLAPWYFGDPPPLNKCLITPRKLGACSL